MRASAEIVIERPMEAVWRWASDPAHWHRWEQDLGEIRTEDYEITQSSPPRRQVVRAVSGRFPFEGTLELSEDVGGTRVRHSSRRGPRGRAGTLPVRSSPPAGRPKHAPSHRGAAGAAEDDGGAGGRALAAVLRAPGAQPASRR